MSSEFATAVQLISSRPPHTALYSSHDASALAANATFMQDVSAALAARVDDFVSTAEALQARLAAIPLSPAPHRAAAGHAVAESDIAKIARLEREVAACDRELAAKTALAAAVGAQLRQAHAALGAAVAANAEVHHGLFYAVEDVEDEASADAEDAAAAAAAAEGQGEGDAAQQGGQEMADEQD